MKIVQAVYIGETSGIIIPDLGNIEIKRGAPFTCPEEWIKARVEIEPMRWKIADAKDVK